MNPNTEAEGQNYAKSPQTNVALVTTRELRANGKLLEVIGLPTGCLGIVRETTEIILDDNVAYQLVELVAKAMQDNAGKLTSILKLVMQAVLAHTCPGASATMPYNPFAQQPDNPTQCGNSGTDTK